jgi:glycosyltransferase involved in cell wall biosynthesis
MSDRSGSESSVSVIIPCHNGAKFLADAIASVLAQTYPALEILVIDDGSTDGTDQIVAQYADPVHYIRQTCQGVSVARNAGIQASQGKYLVFLDHDDRLLPHALAIGVACLDQHFECGFVYGRHQSLDSEGNLIGEAAPPEPTLQVSVANDYALMLRGQFPVPPARIMFRREVFQRVGGFDPSLVNSQDYDLCLRVAARFLACRHNQVIAEYRQHDYSKTATTIVSRKLAFTLLALQKQWSLVQGNPEYQRAYRAGRKHFQRLHGHYIPYELATQLKRGNLSGAGKAAIALCQHHPQGWLRYGMELSVKLARRLGQRVVTVPRRLSSPNNF